jgi:hypothetical protein
LASKLPRQLRGVISPERRHRTVQQKFSDVEAECSVYIQQEEYGAQATNEKQTANGVTQLKMKAWSSEGKEKVKLTP